MTINYDPSMHLELWVQDTGVLDGYSAFVNGNIIDDVTDGRTHVYPFPRPSGPAVITLQFGGIDGGRSAIVNNGGPGARRIVEGQQGMRHIYEIVP